MRQLLYSDSDDDIASQPSQVQHINGNDDVSDESSNNQLAMHSDQSSEQSEISPQIHHHIRHQTKEKDPSPERVIFHFHGASGKVISYGSSIQFDMKAKRNHH